AARVAVGEVDSVMERRAARAPTEQRGAHGGEERNDRAVGHGRGIRLIDHRASSRRMPSGPACRTRRAVLSKRAGRRDAHFAPVRRWPPAWRSTSGLSTLNSTRRLIARAASESTVIAGLLLP